MSAVGSTGKRKQSESNAFDASTSTPQHNERAENDNGDLNLKMNIEEEETAKKKAKMSTKRKSCNKCKDFFPPECFSKTQYAKRVSTCVSCLKISSSVTHQECQRCTKILEISNFSKKQRKLKEVGLCISCHKTSVLERPCANCKQSLERMKYLKSQWKGSAVKIRYCNLCIEDNKKLTLKLCHECNLERENKHFCNFEWNKMVSGEGSDSASTCRVCNECNLKKRNEIGMKKQCERCKLMLQRDTFSKGAWKVLDDEQFKSRVCKACHGNIRDNNELKCHSCNIYMRRQSFSNAQEKGHLNRIRSCISCLRSSRPVKGNNGNTKDSNTETNSNDPPAANDRTTAKEKKEIKAKKKKKEKNENIETDPAVIKRLISQRSTILPKNYERKKIQFVWETSPISCEDEKQMKAHVVARGRFGRVTEEEKENLVVHIQSSDTTMSVEQAISLRSSILQQKSMSNHHLLRRYADELLIRYKKGESIIELSHFVDCPPMNVFRTILAMMNFSKAKIKKSFRDPQKEFKAREQSEFRIADAADIVSASNQDAVRNFADAFENSIATFLERKGVKFVTQKILELEQKKMFGKALVTPDFLILDEFEVNGQRVTWIDAKAYYGANLASKRKDTTRQMCRYINHWGEGAIMYLQGYNEGMKINGCTMLNAQQIMSSEDFAALEEHSMIQI